MLEEGGGKGCESVIGTGIGSFRLLSNEEEDGFAIACSRKTAEKEMFCLKKKKIHLPLGTSTPTAPTNPTTLGKIPARYAAYPLQLTPP